MASTAKTQEFFIGDLDLRLSMDLTRAGELGPDDSIGLVTDCKVAMTTNEVKMQAGFPQRTYATAVTSRDLEISGNLTEYTATNLAFLYGDKEALEAAKTATAAETELTASFTGGGTDLVVAGASDFAVDDYIYVRAANDATDVFCAQVAAVDSGTNTITVTYPISRDFAVGDKVVKGSAIVLGAETSIPPMTIQVVGVMPLDGEPFVYDIWKATISGTVEVASSTDNFGALAYTISPLTPATQEIDCDVYGTDPAKKAMIRKFTQGRLAKGIGSGTC
jgi:hypothetical protein